ncbi:MAG: anti-sigma factor [Candidatus Devosia phytovorans]|uniref:Anti-sigma factor n=1 Tax=Candidatus Devosia phytovorans TaxID=3121372 RepID=A0AAJ6B1T8_9HYPH|nr:anti-sigma factor [Devosia sp.]WEK04763.1 MAG: anti-sigma factor [Devosia sp.]
MTPITRDMLMAFADGQLSEPDRLAVQAHLASNADAAAEVALIQRQNLAIETLFAPAGAEPVPARLKPTRLAEVHKSRRWQTLQRAAMITLLLAAGMAAGWLLRPTTQPGPLYDRLIADAVSAHTVYVAENRHAVEVAGTDAEHLSSWLSNRLATNLPMPDLTAQGLTFMGGRLLPAPAIPGGRAAQLMYEDVGGERLTLYITPSQGVDGPDYESVNFGADTALYWANPLITCTIVGNEQPETFQAIANTVFAQLSPGPASERVYRG